MQLVELYILSFSMDCPRDNIRNIKTPQRVTGSAIMLKYLLEDLVRRGTYQRS